MTTPAPTPALATPAGTGATNTRRLYTLLSGSHTRYDPSTGHKRTYRTGDRIALTAAEQAPHAWRMRLADDQGQDPTPTAPTSAPLSTPATVLSPPAHEAPISVLDEATIRGLAELLDGPAKPAVATIEVLDDPALLHALDELETAQSGRPTVLKAIRARLAQITPTASDTASDAAPDTAPDIA